MNDAVVRALVAALVVLSLPGTAIAGTGAPTADASVSTASPAALAAVEHANDNETVRHQNPDEYDGDGDQDQLEAWLLNRLSSQLQDSTAALSEGEYDRARDFVDEDYHDRLGQYVEVAGETDSAGTDEENDTEAAYREAAAEQARLADRIEEYRETRAEYEAALEAGDDERARELARELEDLYAEIDDASENAVTHYDEISEGTGEDFSDAARAVNETRDDIAAEQTVVREQQFVETELVLETDDETASFSDPLVARGEVRTADGSTIESEEIQLLVNGEPVTAQRGTSDWWAGDDSATTFELEYRPTMLELANDTVTVEYVPDPESAYLGSETDIGIAAEQDEPTIEGLETTDAVAYNDSLAVSGELTVDGIPVDGVPLEVTLGGERLGTVDASDGTFADSFTVPANVSDGGETVRVSFPFEERALASTTAEAPVRVAETETELTTDVAAIGEDELAVDGTLATADGDGLANQSIEVRVEGTTVETLGTDSSGEFSETVTLPSAATDDDDEVTVAIDYEGTGTSLAAATTETAVPVPGGEGGLLDGVSRPVLAGLGLLLAIAAAGGVRWWRRERSGVDRSDRDSPIAPTPSETDGDADESSSPSRALVDSLVTRATDQLSSGRPDTAVRSCYGAVRYAYGAAIGESDALTHWEFYQRYESTGDAADATTEQLRDLIETYERAAFTDDTVPESVAERVLERTQQLCDADSRPDGSTPSESRVSD